MNQTFARYEPIENGMMEHDFFNFYTKLLVLREEDQANLIFQENKINVQLSNLLSTMGDSEFIRQNLMHYATMVGSHTQKAIKDLISNHDMILTINTDPISDKIVTLKNEL